MCRKVYRLVGKQISSGDPLLVLCCRFDCLYIYIYIFPLLCVCLLHSCFWLFRAVCLSVSGCLWIFVRVICFVRTRHLVLSDSAAHGSTAGSINLRKLLSARASARSIIPLRELGTQRARALWHLRGMK